jgi:hypothetical protein
MIVNRLRSNLYRDTRNTQTNLYPDGKKCAPAFALLLRGRLPLLFRPIDANYQRTKIGGSAGITSGNTTSPYCRAVSLNLELFAHNQLPWLSANNETLVAPGQISYINNLENQTICNNFVIT